MRLDDLLQLAWVKNGRCQAIKKMVAGREMLIGFERRNKRSRKSHDKVFLSQPIPLDELRKPKPGTAGSTAGKSPEGNRPEDQAVAPAESPTPPDSVGLGGSPRRYSDNRREDDKPVLGTEHREDGGPET